MGFGSFTPYFTPLKAHNVDADTVAHWKFDGDLTDSGTNSLDLTSGSYYGAPLDFISNTKCLSMQSTDIYRQNDATLRIYTAISIAALVYLRSAPGSNVPILGMGAIGGGTGSSNNYPYSLEVNSDRSLRYIHQWGSKTTHTYDATGLFVPLNTWCWVGFTRDSAGTGITLFLDTDTETTTAASAPTDGVNSDFVIGTKWDSTNLDMCIASVIVKDIEVTNLAAWRAETNIHRI